MFLLNNTNYKYSNSHFQKALDESDKETFTKDDIHTKALMDFCEDFSKKKNKEAELAELVEFFLSLVFRTPRGFFLQDCDRNLCNASELKQAGRYDQRRAQRKSIIQTLENVERSLQFTNILTNYIKEETNIDITKN